MEITFVMFKPEVLQRALLGELISRFERKGLKLVEIMMIQLPLNLLKAHYAHLEQWQYFRQYMLHLADGPSVLVVWSGPNAIQVARDMIGSTDPAKALPGTIRFDYGLTDQRNLVHASATREEAEKEIDLWFGRFYYATDWKRSLGKWIDWRENDDEQDAT